MRACAQALRFVGLRVNDLGAAMGQAREKTQTGGVMMSYRYEDGSLQKLLEERGVQTKSWTDYAAKPR